MTTQQSRVDFYVPEVQDSDSNYQLWDLLEPFAKNGKAPPHRIRGGRGFELRELYESQDTREMWGVIAKARDEDLPNLGELGGDERPVDIGERESLLEKNYFMFARDLKIVAYQHNGHAVTSGQFEAYLSAVTGFTVRFHPVLQPDAHDRLLRDSAEAKMVEMTVAAPKSPDMLPENDWARHVVQAATLGGGQTLHVKLSPGSSGPAHTRRLWPSIKRAASELADRGFAPKVARVTVVENGVEHPIDLIADRLYTYQTIQKRGRYPAPESMYAALSGAIQECREDLVAILGGPQGAPR